MLFLAALSSGLLWSDCCLELLSSSFSPPLFARCCCVFPSLSGIPFRIFPSLIVSLPSPLPFFLAVPSLRLSFGIKSAAISPSPLCQSQPVADPSSEGDYPSISISHTLISHVSLRSFVSATPHPEWRDFLIIAGLRGF